MTINPVSGLVSWSPPLSFFGPAPVTVQASSCLGTATQSFTINVVDKIPPTTPGTPTLVSVAPTSATMTWAASTDSVGVTGYSVYWVCSVGHSGRGGGVTTYHILEATTNGATTATITGLSPGESYNFEVVATDATGNTSAYSGGLLVNMTPPSGLTITDASNTPSTYSVASAPSNDSINPTTGVVSWIPTAAQAARGIALTFQRTNSFCSAQIAVNPAIYTTDAPQNIRVTGTNGWSPTVTWTLPSYNDNLIAGYRFMISGGGGLNENYTINGAVTSTNLWLSYNPGSYILNMQSFGANGEGLWTSYEFTYNPVLPDPQYTINSNGGQAIGIIGQPVSIQLSDFNTIYNPSMTPTYSLVSGPAGMTVDPTTGMVTWTPTEAQVGTQSMDFRVTNSAGTADLPLTLTVSDFATAPTNVTVDPSQASPLVTWTAPTTIAGDPIASYTLTATGQGGTPYTYIAAATATSASLTGLPQGTYTLTLQAFDATGSPGAVSTPVTFTFPSSAPLPNPVYYFTTNSGYALGFVGQPVSAQVYDTSGGQGDSYAIASGPAGMTIDPVLGVLNWTPSAAGDVSAVVAVTNSAGTADVTIPITVTAFAGPPTSINVMPTGQTLPTVTWSPPITAIGDPVDHYLITLTDQNNNVTTYTAPSTASSLGLPNLAASSYSFTVQAVDASGVLGLPAGPVSFYYDPNAPNPTYTVTSNGSASWILVGQTMTVQVTDLNGSSGDSVSIASGPADMAIDQTGLLTWTPTSADIGYAYPVVAVTNSYGTSYAYLSLLAAFASPVTNLAASGSASAETIDVSWSAPATAIEPIAGYTVMLTWTDSSGTQWSSFGSTAAGVTSFSMPAFAGVSTYTVTVNAVDAAGNPGAPSTSITFTLS
jgi:hypothetical protein